MTETAEEHGTDLEKYESRQPITVAPPETGLSQQESFFTSMERLAASPNVDVEKFKQILDMQEQILDRNAKQAFNAAMTEAQNKIELVVAKKYNNQTKSNYANLKEILIQTKPIYTAEGFSLMFYEGETEKEGHKRVCVDIMHRDGHTEKRYGDLAIQTTGIAGKAMMTQIHGEGSAFSYGRRYLTCMIFNIPTGDDDDGNAAGAKKESKFTTEAQKKEIGELFKMLGITDPEDIKKRYADRFEGITTLDEVFTESADILIRSLKKMIKKKGGQNV